MEPVPTGGKLGFIEATSPGQCVGTLRWDESSRFPRLPAWPASLVGDEAPLPEGWRGYLEMRLLPDAGGVIRVEPPMLDGLSYPLSLLHAMRLLRLRPPSHETLTVLIIGSSSKAEARLLRDSNYWDELVHFLPSAVLHLVFVGPEIAEIDDGVEVAPPSPRLSAECVRGTLGALLAQRPQLTAANTVCVGFNTGMGSGLYPLMQSWLPDLTEMLRREMVCIFTCANDYSDLKGELLVFQLLGAQLVLKPQRSPFKAATIVRAPSSEKSANGGVEWSCSSCFLYAVRGRTEGAPPLVEGPTLLSALKKLAKHHKKTQMPSEVP